MKTITTACLFLFTIGFAINSYGQDFESMLKNNKFNMIKQHLADEVNVQFGHTKRLVSSPKAIQLLKQNLDEFEPVKWETLHEGASNEQNSNYVILKLYNQENEGVRLFLHLEEKGKIKKITSIRMRQIL